ncbi:tachykinin-like peptides receptor 86C [Trichonephila clavata]|uniref:Tachykinin-like peptides receptor 86C n=1 Tax=Trichonephila clavata TaxID=2740835 RepID=A0A8X6I722_TRICU|nr:tachykinin-like peptides receptor 86C [Trichonephila clavata]
MSKLAAYAILASVWLAGGALACPSLIYSTTMTFRYADRGHRTICYLVWPDGPAGHSYSDHIYNIIFLVVTYVLPMCSMAVTYTWVGCVLWGSKVIGEHTVMQNDVIRSKQRVVHMLIAIVVLFGVCWLPYHIYFLYVYHHQEAIVSDYIQHVYLAIYWLAMSNSCYNPIVYYWMNSRFRDYFRTVMCFPKRGFRRSIWRKDRPKIPKTTTFTCSTRSRSCRVTLPLPRANNNHFQPPRYMCSRL